MLKMFSCEEQDGWLRFVVSIFMLDVSFNLIYFIYFLLTLEVEGFKLGFLPNKQWFFTTKKAFSFFWDYMKIDDSELLQNLDNEKLV